MYPLVKRGKLNVGPGFIKFYSMFRVKPRSATDVLCKLARECQTGHWGSIHSMQEQCTTPSESVDLLQHACEASHFQSDSLLFPLLATRSTGIPSFHRPIPWSGRTGRHVEGTSGSKACSCSQDDHKSGHSGYWAHGFLKRNWINVVQAFPVSWPMQQTLLVLEKMSGNCAKILSGSFLATGDSGLLNESRAFVRGSRKRWLLIKYSRY